MFKKLRKTTMSCAVCEGTMDHFLTIPAAHKFPELVRFRCCTCGCYKTVESSSLLPDDKAA